MSQHTIKKKPQYIIPLIILLLTIWGILTLRVDASWFEHHGDNGRWISTGARNYVLYGASELRYLVTTDPAPTAINDLEYYVHHPPLIVWLVSLSSDIFGRYNDDSQFIAGTPYELSARLIPIFATMISLCAFYVIVRRLFGSRLAFLALVLYSFTPMTMYFGRMVNHEPLALAFLYLFIAIFIKWMRYYAHTRTLALIVLAGLAMWSAWAPVFFLFTLGIVALILGQKRQRIGIILIGVAILFITGAIFFYYGLAFDGTFDTLIEAFIFRTGNQSFSRNSEPFTLLEFVARQASHMLTTLSFAVVILGGYGIWITFRHYKHLQRAIPLALILAGVLYMIIFRNAVFVHDYYKIYLMAGMSITATVAMKYIFGMRQYGIQRYARPIAVSIVVTSFVASFWWTNSLYQIGMSDFPDQVVSGVIENTKQDDLILTNLAEGIQTYSYYTYRDIRSMTITTALKFAESEDRSTWYLLCAGLDKSAVAGLPDLLADTGFIPIAEECQLISLNLE
jgi:4-amino-4-deoxy-L-arabinose transferase-like glycosyltransferase